MSTKLNIISSFWLRTHTAETKKKENLKTKNKVTNQTFVSYTITIVPWTLPQTIETA